MKSTSDLVIGWVQSKMKRFTEDVTKIAASAGYMRKERVREILQELITSAIVNGEVKDQKELDALIATIDMAAKTLRMIPFDVYAKLAKGKKK